MHVQSAGVPGEEGEWRYKLNPKFVWGKRGRPELKNPALKVVKRGVQSRNVEVFGNQIRGDKLWIARNGGMM